MKRLNILVALILISLISCKNIESKSGYIEINETKIYYEIAGTGEPLVLIHGWILDSRCWDYQFDEFSHHYRVLRYDLRGFGRSSLPDTNKSYSHTTDLVSLLDTLQIDKAHILGHSFGGTIAIDFVLNNPQRVHSLILADAAMNLQGYKVTDEAVKSWLTDTWKTSQEKGIEEAKKTWLNGSPFKQALKNKRAAILLTKMVNEYSGWHWKNNDPDISPKPYPQERLNDIKVPTLILVGELNTQIYHEITDIQRKNIPNSTKKIIPNSGHMLNIENPDKFNDYVLNFLSEN